MSKPKAIPRNVSMYAPQWSIVDALAESMGISASAATRIIVTEYSRAYPQSQGNDQPLTVPRLTPKGKQPDPNSMGFSLTHREILSNG